MTRKMLTGCTLALLLAAAGCGSLETAQPEQEVPEIYPGILQGYLPMDEPLDSKAFVPTAPASALELGWYHPLLAWILRNHVFAEP